MIVTEEARSTRRKCWFSCFPK